MSHGPLSVGPVVLSIWNKRQVLSSEKLPSKHSIKQWLTEVISFKWYLCSEELWGSRISEGRGRKRANYPNPSLQNLEVNGSAAEGELALSGWVCSELCLLSLPLSHMKTKWESWLWGPEACLAKNQLLQSTFRESVINLIVYHLLRWVWELLLSQETLPVLPQCLVAWVVTAAWGEQGSAVLPAAGAWRSIAGVTLTWTLPL